MGIRGLNKLISSYATSCIEKIELKCLRGARIAIDTSILIHKFKYGRLNSNAHIYGFLNRCLLYVRAGIIPVFVFDGKPLPEKSHTLHRRRRKNLKLEQQLNDVKSELDTTTMGHSKEKLLNQMESLKRKVCTVTQKDHEEIQTLLSYLGFETISSKNEAENLCVLLQKLGFVDYTYSDDTDVFALGCERILRNHHHDSFHLIHLSDILSTLKLSYEQFLDLCILCGCDYCPSLPRMTFERAYEYIIKYKTIENVLENVSMEAPGRFMLQYKQARNVFHLPDKENIRICKHSFQERKLHAFLKQKQIHMSKLKYYMDQFRQKKRMEMN
jgi:flap endonuclease-1